MTVQRLPAPGGLLARALAAARSSGRVDMAFGGWVLADGSGLDITEMSGALTGAMANLRVRSGDGVGGKALALRRPVSVSSYRDARGITHLYDHAVAQERLEPVAALPVVVDSVPRMVLYLGHRGTLRLGDRWFDRLAPIVRRLEREIAVEDEVRRRLARAATAVPSPPAGGLPAADVREVAAELAELAELVDDPAVRERIDRLRGRLESRPAVRRTDIPRLAPREVDVLAQVARGLSNREVAEELGLRPETVKSYLKDAMRKLDVGNRVQAIAAARAAGQIR